jgi:subfamily B ATP-binding cassette protein MsbA
MNDSYTRQMVKMYRKTDLAGPLSEFLGVGILVILIYFGGKLVISETISPSVFITYIAVFSQVLPPAKSITVAYYNVQKGIASTERIEKILDADETIKNPAYPVFVNNFESYIEYNHVSFAYTKGEIGYVLKDINLRIEKGKTIAIVGQSGSGKTTLADMIPRFYDPSSGEVLIDGRPLQRIDIESLRGLMSIVSQESILFNDTVFNNIALGMPNATEEEVMKAAEIANAHDFIMAMPDGYKTEIGDRGSKLSGGQRQRISIARAVLKNPPILILDEATSALDTESERLVQDALVKLMQNRTSVVIAHRLSTIQHADEIIVIHQGQIIERGTHSELLESSGTYRKLYDMQAFS